MQKSQKENDEEETGQDFAQCTAAGAHVSSYLIIKDDETQAHFELL
jgi:hypothetical protein